MSDSDEDEDEDEERSFLFFWDVETARFFLDFSPLPLLCLRLAGDLLRLRDLLGRATLMDLETTGTAALLCLEMLSSVLFRDFDTIRDG